MVCPNATRSTHWRNYSNFVVVDGNTCQYLLWYTTKGRILQKLSNVYKNPTFQCPSTNNNHTLKFGGPIRAADRNVKTVYQIPLPLRSKRSPLCGPLHYPAWSHSLLHLLPAELSWLNVMVSIYSFHIITVTVILRACVHTHTHSTPELLSRSSTEHHELHYTKNSVTIVSVILGVYIHI